jgi:hypothetical protein
LLRHFRTDQPRPNEAGPQVRVADEVFEKLDRCCIQPLQVVDEERERVLFLRTCGKKSSKYGVTFCSSFTTEDLPTPEWPDTSTSSDVPLEATRKNASRNASLSLSWPYSLSGQEPIWHVVRAESEWVDSAQRHDFPETPPEVGLDAGCRLSFRSLALAPKTGSDAESREPDIAGRGLNKDVCRLDVLVNEACRVQLA